MKPVHFHHQMHLEFGTLLFLVGN